MLVTQYLCFFFFNDTATTEIYTLSLHDALPIYRHARGRGPACAHLRGLCGPVGPGARDRHHRSEEHTSELQSQSNLVCRLLLEKKKKKNPHVCCFSYLFLVMLSGAYECATLCTC